MPFDPKTAFAPSSNGPSLDGIDDWYVPGSTPGGTDYPDDWYVPTSARAAAPYPDDWYVPAPPATPSMGQPAPIPQPDAANPGISNPPATRPDPFAAYWALIPASRVGAMAWHPPIFPNSPGQFPVAAPPPRDLPPDFGTGGLLGGIRKMLAASAPRNVPSDIGTQGLLGGIAKLQQTSRAAPASLLGPPGGAADQSPSLLRRFADLGWVPTGSGAAGDYPRVNGFDADQQPSPYIARDQSNRNDQVERVSARGLSGLPPLGNSAAESNSIRTAQAEVPGSPAMIGPALRAAVAAGRLTEEEAAVLQQRASALGAGRDERLHAAISAGLPKYDGKTTYGVLITNEGNAVPLQSGQASPLYSNYPPASHVEGKAAIWIRENGSAGGVLYHNNTGGTCGFCNSQIRTLLPEGARLRVVPPGNAAAKNSRANESPTDYTGNGAMPNPPAQHDLFGRQP